jgi:hypothetical protein
MSLGRGAQSRENSMRGTGRNKSEYDTLPGRVPEA